MNGSSIGSWGWKWSAFDAAGFGGAAFVPTDISGLVLWHDPTDITTLWTDSGRSVQVASDGDVIGAMDDKSAGGDHAIQATAAAKPLYKTGIINSLPVARFDGTDDGMQTTAVDLSGTTGATVFIIINSSTTDATDMVLEQGASTAASDGFWMVVGNNAGGAGNRTNGTLADNSGQLLVADDTWNDGNDNIILFKGDSTGTSAVYLNGGTADNTDTTNYGNHTNKVFNIGARDDAASLFYAGDMGELLIYNTALSTADLNTVGNYLADKWGMTWGTIS